MPEMIIYFDHLLFNLFIILLFTHDFHFFWHSLDTVDFMVTVQSSLSDGCDLHYERIFLVKLNLKTYYVEISLK